MCTTHLWVDDICSGDVLMWIVASEASVDDLCRLDIARMNRSGRPCCCCKPSGRSSASTATRK
jgi:hypothetical protein